MLCLPQPPWGSSFKRLESATRRALFEYSLLEGVSRLAVAVSGGKDSITLLALLNAICGKGTHPIELVCLHVSGAFSCGAGVTREYLEQVCKNANIPFCVKELPKDYSPADCYTCSRIRRKLLFDMAKSFNCSTIAFGHHREDNIQTLLMNLCHKGEFAGLLPKITLVKYGITIIRPFIYLKEKDITLFAKKHGFFRMTCSCPHGKESFRKKTDNAIDVLSHLYPHTRENLSSASLKYGSQKAAKNPCPKQRELKLK